MGQQTYIFYNLSGLPSKRPRTLTSNAATYTTAWTNGRELKEWKLIGECSSNRRQSRILLTCVSTRGRGWHSFGRQNEDSLLVCRTRTPKEIEHVKDREAAEQQTQATRVLKEALKLSRGDPRALAQNYFELKLNLTTFCALLHTLFGNGCAYFASLMRI